ncbi:MAG: FAD binding domain-containing protein [Peptococcaceae bacterium]|nr:FAD binding domain-containing protein [Peptococcaceae bacterium]
MFTLRDLVQPDTVEEAYKILTDKRNNTVLGGCAYLKMGAKRIGTAVDLSKLQLDYIKEQEGYIEIGAMTSLRALETHSCLLDNFNGIVPLALGNIVGVQLRNVATLGASVFAKYGFSDLLTVLLALDTEVELHQAGRMSLTEFLDRPYAKDILTRIFIKMDGRQASYQCLRNSAGDYPILNVAVSRRNNRWQIVVGARPLKAKFALQTAAALTVNNPEPTEIARIAAAAAQELSFGTNIRATAAYRRAMCKVLVQRALTEVVQCK